MQEEDDTDREAQERSQEGHDAVERWEDDRQDDNHNHDKDTHQRAANFLHLLGAVVSWQLNHSKSAKNLKCGDKRTSADFVSGIKRARAGTHFNGTFARGIIAINTMIPTDIDCG